MKRLAALAALLLVAAAPQLLVELSFTDAGAATITGYERTEGDDPTRTSGDWTLELRDEQGRIVEQTTFEPYLIGPSGEPTYLEELHVPISAPAAAREIVVLDADQEAVAAYQIRATCGDLRCDENERGTCDQDCSPEAAQGLEQARTVPYPEQESGRSAGFWLGIGAIALLIIVLVLVLIHVNRKKPNPVRGEYRTS